MIFFFLLKTLFSLEIITFLSWLFGYVEKQLDKRAMVIFKIYDITENYAQKLVGFLVRTSLFLNVATFIKVHCIILLLFGSSHWRCSLKIGKHLCPESLSLSGACKFILKKRFWHRYFPVNFTTFLRTPFSTEHIRVTASDFLLYDEVLSIRLLVGCYHYIAFMVPVNASIKSKLLVEEQFKIKFGYVCLF